ncbi:efflux RND transporter permease subunit [Rhodopirellula sallentina]|uniref:Integral membrane protein n=1 Tax=Rhodopirellula sallentina SM41 TaxID=1263870 RepID=M5TXN0_9BACT|nr:MMPL family transporter [Rhodopirellula sallentina]EMI53769.1 integral membrane protein [Rhodopirellula sallentina SM41]
MSSSSTSRSFLERPGPWGTSMALLVLMGFFFILPSAFRGARLGLKNKENDIKDWLPSDFPETAELDWFAEHFAGESFVLATWPGCTVGDQRLHLLENKLLHESADFREQLLAEEADQASGLSLAQRRTRVRARELGEELKLLPPGQDLDNWGGQDEKWLASADGTWYYITPDGRFYRWEEANNGPAGLLRAIKKSIGRYEIKGKLVTALGEPSTPERINEYYNDPTLLCAPLFETVQTGATIVNDLASEGGALWPVDTTAPEKRPIVAERRAMERLTGSLFAPAVPPGFDWTAENFVTVLPPERRDELPSDYEFRVTSTLQDFADERLDGDLASITSAVTSVQTDAWYAVFDSLEVEAPARLTCLLVTLTDLAKDNLAYAIGRGTLGSPKGRLLALAEQSGVHPPSPPSTAPPPFNREPPVTVGGMPPLRMGGPPIDNIAIDEEGTVTLVRLIGYCILVGVGLSYFCFRSLKTTLMLFVVGGSAAMLSMAMVGWTGGRVDAILLSMPSLVYVLGLSGAIHVINYYRDEVRMKGERGAAGRALRHALLPCSLAALTTAIGLGSLYTSNLKPISNFGLYSAIGVIATLAILFSYLPAALEVFSPKFIKKKKPKKQKSKPARSSEQPTTDAAFPVAMDMGLAAWWAAFGRFITAHYRLVAVGCLVGLVIASTGLFRIETSVQLLKLFDSEARILKDYAWLEENFGKLVPMEIVVRMPREMQRDFVTEDETTLASNNTSSGPASFANAGPLSDDSADGSSEDSDDPIALTLLERIEAVSRIRIAVTRTLGEEGTGEVGQASSMDTFLPPLPGVSNGYDVVRSQMNRRIGASKDELLDSDYVKIEQNGPLSGSEMWRLSLRVSALSDNDYGLFINDLRNVVAPVLEAYRTRAAVLQALSANEGGMTGKQRVLVVGSERVPGLADAALVKEDGSADVSAIFLSTLHELLGNERIRRPIWIDPESPDAKAKPGDPKWEQLVAAVDAVIWVDGIEESLLNQQIGSEHLHLGAASHASEWLMPAKAVIRADKIAAQPITKQIVTIDAASVHQNNPNVVRISKGDRRVPVFDVEKAISPQVVFTGVVPVVYKAQRTLLGSLLESIMMAFVLIGIVMVVLLNPGSFPTQWLAPRNLADGFAAGAVSMIPNLFPVLLVFGLMGLGGVAVDIGTMMTASVAMGVAVDDTIHFLSWFRQFLEEGKTRYEAVIETYRKVGPAMTQTTVVGGLGLFVFALSTFTPTQRFGTLMLVMLAAALIGDLVLLPALLVSPLGKCFKPRLGFLNQPPEGDPSMLDGEQTWHAAGNEPGAASIEDGSAESGIAKTGTGTLVASEDIPVLKVHSPPSRSNSTQPKRK